MADPVVVLLILVAGATSEPEKTHTVASGIYDALGSDARVLFEERAVAPTDQEARGLAAAITVSAVAELEWLDRDRSRVNVHVYMAAEDTFVDRELTFGKNDAPEERERAIGLLVGSMVRNAFATRADANADEQRVDSAAATTAPSVAPSPTPLASGAGAERVATPPPSTSRTQTAGARRFTPAIDASATGAVPVGGDGSGVGPALGGEAFVGAPSRFGLRLSGAARFGAVDSAQATTSTFRLGVGPVVRILRADTTNRIGVQVSVEALALNQVVTRTGPNARRDRWQAGTYATVHVGYRIFAGVEPFLGVGLETAFGSTPINVDGATAAVLPQVRLTADAGARLYF